MTSTDVIVFLFVFLGVASAPVLFVALRPRPRKQLPGLLFVWINSISLLPWNVQYHTTVADHILSLRVNGDPVPLPRWLVLSFKVTQVCFFASYLIVEHLETAASSVIKAIWILWFMGRGSEVCHLSVNWLSPGRSPQYVVKDVCKYFTI